MKTTLLFLSMAVMTAACNNGAEQQAAQTRQLDSMKNEMEKKNIIDSMNASTTTQVAVPSATHTNTHNTTVYHETDNTTRNAANAPANTTNVPAPAAAPKKQRKGIGPEATGAIIGAGAGAITGAMVDKKKGEGAVVGGLLGAGVGLGAGAIIKNEQKKKDN
jgi:hypothetical protein